LEQVLKTIPFVQSFKFANATPLK